MIDYFDNTFNTKIPMAIPGSLIPVEIAAKMITGFAKIKLRLGQS